MKTVDELISQEARTAIQLIHVGEPETRIREAITNVLLRVGPRALTEWQGITSTMKLREIRRLSNISSTGNIVEVPRGCFEYLMAVCAEANEKGQP